MTNVGTSELNKFVENVDSYRRDDGEAVPFQIDKDYYTSGQAARLLEIPDRTIRRYLSTGRIAGTQHPITGTWQIGKQALIRFIEESGCNVVQVSKQVNIHIVNDEPAMIGFLELALQRALPGAIVETLNDACNALIQIGETKPDIVILKAKMPVLYGRDILLAIRNNKTTTKTKVLALSGMPDDLDELTDLGADESLMAPFTYKELTDKIRLLLPGGVTLSV
ncbi:MAG: response regulator [Proteobacteria bacterium]|nr:response regulator [Pseudomonadota bacterium]